MYVLHINSIFGSLPLPLPLSPWPCPPKYPNYHHGKKLHMPQINTKEITQLHTLLGSVSYIVIEMTSKHDGSLHLKIPKLLRGGFEI